MKKRKKRIYAMLLCVCMVLSLISAPVSAAETRGTAGSHEHTSECYTWTEQCTHEHTPECYSEDSISENEATPSEAEEPACVPIYAAKKVAVSQKNGTANMTVKAAPHRQPWEHRRGIRPMRTRNAKWKLLRPPMYRKLSPWSVCRP